jgi:hypothetical protein
MTRSLPNTLLLGDSRLEEFEPVVRWLRERDDGGRFRLAADVRAAHEVPGDEDWIPDLVVVLQSWPDQYSVEDFHGLLTKFPLARLVLGYGPWCDSDGRTRSIWPLAVRVPATAAVPRLERELTLFETPAPTVPLLPLTASRTEIFEFDFGCGQSPAAPAGKVIVISPDRAWREMMQRMVGPAAASNGAAEPPDLVLFDADPWDEERAEALAAIRAAVPGGRLVAFVGFPRPDLEAELRQTGADEVRFKLEPSGLLFSRE